MLIDNLFKSLKTFGTDIIKRIIKEANCTEDGMKECTCPVCKKTYQEIIPKLGHSYATSITTSPTCESMGIKTYTCSKCNDSYTVDLSPLGHDYASTVTPPTCTENGYKIYTCLRCGNSYTETIPTPGHNYNNGICTICGNKASDIENDMSLLAGFYNDNNELLNS